MGLGDPVVYDSHPLWGFSPKANAKYLRFDGDIVTINNVGLRSKIDWNSDQKKFFF